MEALDYIAGLADGRMSIEDLVLAVQDRLDAEGLDWLSPCSGHPGHLTRPRPHELHAALVDCEAWTSQDHDSPGQWHRAPNRVTRSLVSGRA